MINGMQMNADLQDKKVLLFKKKHKIMGMGGNLRISETICVLIKISNLQQEDI